MKKILIALILASALLASLSPRVSQAQSAITVTQNQVQSKFPDSLVLKLSASSSSNITDINLKYWTNGASCQDAKAQQTIEFDPATQVDAEWEWDFTLSGVLPPGVQVFWQWEIKDAAGNSLVTDEQTYLVNDTRHTWHVLKSEGINLQWYEGDWSFGSALQSIATQSLHRLETEAGISPTGEIWITIYPTTQEIKEVDIHVYEWAGGIAYPEYNSTIIAIGTSELDWAATTIPHEIAHLVSEAVVFNCRGIWMPTWLSEGLAKYAEGDIQPYYTDMVLKALKDKELPPLRTLESGFSSDTEEALRSYGHSVMIVSYMIEQFGPEKISSLLSSIQTGNKIDKALLAVYQLDTDGIEAMWRKSLGFKPQPTLAPTNANRTAVPTMALWTSVFKKSSTPTSTPTETPTRVPFTATPQPTLSASPTPLPVASVQDPIDTNAELTSAKPPSWIIVLAVALVFVIGGVVVYFVQHSRRKLT